MTRAPEWTRGPTALKLVADAEPARAAERAQRSAATKKTTPKSEKTRILILEAAVDALDRYGFHGTNLAPLSWPVVRREQKICKRVVSPMIQARMLRESLGSRAGSGRAEGAERWRIPRESLYCSSVVARLFLDCSSSSGPVFPSFCRSLSLRAPTTFPGFSMIY